MLNRFKQSHATTLRRATAISLNSHKHDVPKMLNETKALLDDLYCEENMELSRMLGGRPLPGYSCAEDGIVGQ